MTIIGNDLLAPYFTIAVLPIVRITGTENTDIRNKVNQNYKIYQPIDENSSSREVELLDDELWSSLLSEEWDVSPSSSVERSATLDSNRTFFECKKEESR